MKKMKNLFLMIVGMTFIISCESNHKKSDINLNNGEKWTVNSEMTPHIEQESLLLDEYISNQDKDYHRLAENLKSQNNALIKSCTMKGESHDELHKWLLPHMELIEKLSNASNSDETEITITELKKSFKTYHNHFK